MDSFILHHNFHAVFGTGIGGFETNMAMKSLKLLRNKHLSHLLRPFWKVDKSSRPITGKNLRDFPISLLEWGL